MAHRDDIVTFCDELLDSASFRDIAQNGLQIEGKQEVRKITTAVSCNQHTIDAAVENGSDAILVHHGLVLNGQVGDIRGPVRNRLSAILANDISLIGYHLPLDGQPEIGNNARLAAELGLEIVEPLDTFGPPAVGYICQPPSDITTEQLQAKLEALTGQAVIRLDGGREEVWRVAVLCGSGAPALDEAAEKQCQVLLTGDAREPSMAMARESGVTVLVGGHEATERLGVQALAEKIRQHFGVDYTFVPDPNPL